MKPGSMMTVVVGADGPSGAGGGGASDLEVQLRQAQEHAINNGARAIELMTDLAAARFCNRALEAKLEATMADMRSIARARDNYQAEAARLSALAIRLQTELAQRMALPANALKHSWGNR